MKPDWPVHVVKQRVYHAGRTEIVLTCLQMTTTITVVFPPGFASDRAGH